MTRLCSTLSSKIHSPCLGIVGGMGPRAGAYLTQQLSLRAAGASDQDFPDTVVSLCSRRIADRSAYLLGQSPVNPGHAIARELQRLHQAGANVFGIACNTAHADPIYQVILEDLGDAFPRDGLLHMVQLLLDQAVASRCRRPALLASSGTVRSAVYTQAAQDRDLALLLPTEESQTLLQQAIYDPHTGIKAVGAGPKNQKCIASIAAELQAAGADMLLLACTELALIAPYLARHCPLPIRESSAVLIDALLAHIHWPQVNTSKEAYV